MGLVVAALVLVAGTVALALRSGGLDTLSTTLAVLGVLTVLAVCAVGGYKDGWTWTGIGPSSEPKKANVDFQRGKTLWDVLQLLVVPLVLAGVGLLFTAQQEHATQQTSDAQRQDALLSAYLDRMSDLMKQGLGGATSPSWAQMAARARTMATIGRLDAARSAILVRFLSDLQLIPMVDLSGVDVAGADLHNTNLERVKMNFANLTNAYMRSADLRRADLRHAILTGADVTGANLTGADLHHSHLSGVIWKNTTCPDGTKSDDNRTSPSSCIGH